MEMSKSFTAVGLGTSISLSPGESATYELTGTFVATVRLEKSNNLQTWDLVTSATGAVSGTVKNETTGPLWFRFRCSAYTSGTAVTTIADVDDTVQEIKSPTGRVLLRLKNDTVEAPNDFSFGGKVEITRAYTTASGSSYQVVAIDLDVAAAAGSNDGTDPAFLAPIMGNILGDTVAGVGNYLAGLIGYYSIIGAGGSEYPRAGVIGGIAEAVEDADALVLGVIDGDDGGAATRAGAAFGVRVLNNNAGSGVNYGLDLFAPDNANYTGGTQPLNVSKAQIRMSDETCVLTGDGAPVDGTTGDDFAGPGSLYIDITNANAYINAGTKTDSVWKLITRAA